MQCRRSAREYQSVEAVQSQQERKAHASGTAGNVTAAKSGDKSAPGQIHHQQSVEAKAIAVGAVVEVAAAATAPVVVVVSVHSLP